MKRILLALLILLALPAGASAHPLGNFSVNHDAKVTVRDDRVDVTYILDQAEIPTFRERDKSPGEVLAATRAEATKRLVLTVDGTRVALRPTGEESIEFRPGDGGLKTTYAVVELTAPVADAGQVDLRDETFPGRAGRKRVLSEAEQPDGFGGLFADAAAGQGVLALLLLAALGWGALHALSPGHGKAMVAAYLIGTKGRPRHAIALGVTVTVTHTIGVFALGFVTLGLSAYFLPEDLYPWLTLVSALLVLVVGAGVLRSRLKQRGHHHHHHHGHDHHHDVSWKGVLGMGTAAGLLPCPSALVVLLAAISQHEVALGMLLIVAFSVGLALTLTVLGLAVVWARRLPIGARIPKRLATAVPSISAALIMGVGFVLTANAIPAVV
jgi:ABC-type nickel/cobalt efflux system permease component RcnA